METRILFPKNGGAWVAVSLNGCVNVATKNKSDIKVKKMQIHEISLGDLQGRMGAESDERDARIMLALLSETHYLDTDEIPESEWLDLLNKVCTIRRNENECNQLRLEGDYSEQGEI